MQADGRLDEGRVRSILGFHLANVGETRFFADLAELGDVAFVDYRVIMAHFGELPSRADRFAADLRQPAAIANPMLRRFVEAAMRAPNPVILGGHSLVAGGLLALIEAAWGSRSGPPAERAIIYGLPTRTYNGVKRHPVRGTDGRATGRNMEGQDRTGPDAEGRRHLGTW